MRPPALFKKRATQQAVVWCLSAGAVAVGVQKRSELRPGGVEMCPKLLPSGYNRRIEAVMGSLSDKLKTGIITKE